MNFEISSSFSPTGDQPEAIAALSEGIKSGVPFQTLLGVTGSGKTFTIANVIKEVQRPTLILSHNKTLAAQLYSEFKAFFPNNAVEYFVSYYDYYQPEAYLPSTDTYIEKDLAINEEIDKLRLRATASLLSGRKDVIVVSSVSCLYGMADPTAFAEKVTHLERGMRIDRDKLLRRFVDALYVNNKLEFKSGCFRVNGDTVDIFPAIETFDGMAYRIEFWDDEIDRISSFNPLTGEEYDEQDELNIYPTNLFVTTQERINMAIGQIDVDLGTQVNFLKEIGKPFEAKRLYERVTFDLEMIRELGHCSGIENYSRYFDGRAAGDRPFCLLDYFPKDFMLVVDESHVTIPQIRAMYGGDYARKKNFEKAYQYKIAVEQYDDSIRNVRSINSINEIDYRYNQDTTLLKRDILISNNQIKLSQQHNIIILVLALLIISVLLAILIFIHIRRKNEQRYNRQMALATQLSMENIRNRISPHYMFNVLNTVMPTFKQYSELAYPLQLLIQVLRGNLLASEKMAVELQEEIELVKNYIALRKETNPNTIHIEWEITEQVPLQTLIPSMSIQIPVENALKYAFEDNDEQTNTLSIHISKEDRNLSISIRDNGSGYDPGKHSNSKRSTGNGLKVLFRTIELLNSKNTEKIIFDIRNIGISDPSQHGTLVTITIPFNYQFNI